MGCGGEGRGALRLIEATREKGKRENGGVSFFGVLATTIGQSSFRFVVRVVHGGPGTAMLQNQVVMS